MRRVHVPNLSIGRVTLDAVQSRHVRTVLRTQMDETLEVFDAAGKSGQGIIIELEPAVVLKVDALREPSAAGGITIATALPKGDRADWMVEKLSELGVEKLIPLRTARSVVHPAGQKFGRWERIAIEAAKQSRRAGVMRIETLTSLPDFLQSLAAPAFLLTTQGDAKPVASLVARENAGTLVIGPEGGWSDDESANMLARGLTPVSLGPTILRIETAAVLGAGLLQILRSENAS